MNGNFLKNCAKRGICGGGETVLSENEKYCRKRCKQILTFVVGLRLVLWLVCQLYKLVKSLNKHRCISIRFANN